jgi:hypothetical protein
MKSQEQVDRDDVDSRHPSSPAAPFPIDVHLHHEDCSSSSRLTRRKLCEQLCEEFRGENKSRQFWLTAAV